jgi:hypothetical protein
MNNGQSPSQHNNMLITDGSNFSTKPSVKKSLYDSETVKKYIIEKNI